MTRGQSLPRTAAGAHAASLVADRAIASVGAEHDLIVVVSVFPSQLLTAEMLRRPIEFTLHSLVAVMDQLILVRVGAIVKRLLQSIEHKIRP